MIRHVNCKVWFLLSPKNWGPLHRHSKVEYNLEEGSVLVGIAPAMPATDADFYTLAERKVRSDGPYIRARQVMANNFICFHIIKIITVLTAKGFSQSETHLSTKYHYPRGVNV